MPYRLLAPLVGVAVLTSALAAQADSARDTTRAVEVAPITVSAAAVHERSVAPPVATITVDAEHIRRSQATTPYDLLRRVAGIEVHDQGQGPGFAADAVLRGFTSDHSSDVLLVVDGVPINLPVHGHIEGYADWHMLTAPALRELRVIHGPASPRYGNFAFGGVVEAYTDVDTDRSAAAITSSSDGDVGGWVRTGHRGFTGGSLLAVEGKRNEGWRDHAAYWLGNGLLRGWHLAGSGRFDGGVSFYGSSWDSPGFISVAQYNAGDLTDAVDLTDGGDAYRAVLHGRYTGVLGSGGVQASAWAQTLRSTVFLNLPEDGVLEQHEERDRRVAVGGQAQVLWSVAGGDATLGASGRRDASGYDLYQTNARVRQEPVTGLDGDYTNGAVFARWRAIVGSRVALDLGGRLDALHYQSTDRLASSPRPRSATSWVASPKVGARVFLSGSTALLASFSRGFRGAPGVLADPTLPPMTAWAGELGVRYVSGRVTARIAAFRLDVSHERIQDPVTREINDAGASVRQGVSGDVSLLVGDALLSANVTYNDAAISEATGTPSVTRGVDLHRTGVGPVPAVPFPTLHVEPLEPGDPVPGVGQYVGRVTFDAPFTGGLSARATGRFSGPFTPVGEPDRRTQAYAVIDVGGTIRLPFGDALLDVELENVLNTRYPEVRASGFLNPGTHRTLRATLRFGDGPRSSHAF